MAAEAHRKIMTALITILLISFSNFSYSQNLDNSSDSGLLNITPHPDAIPAKALFEWGFLLGHGSIADYPASDEYKYITLPAPYISYRGELLQSDDEDGTRFKLVSTENLNFDLSFGGSFPTDPEKNQARKGMPALDWTLELGPRILYYLHRSRDFGKVRIGLPLRSSFSTDFQRIKQVGYLFAPTFQVDKYKFPTKDMTLYFSATINYLNEGLADYFYEIDPVYQTAERAAYDAKGGYLGWESSLATKYEADGKIFLLGLRYTNFHGSENNTSFLHRTDTGWNYFVGFGWVLFESEQRAPLK